MSKVLSIFKPFISNVRRGHATNSSSSHSLVFYKTEVADNYVGPASAYDDDEYGWGNFELWSLGEKLMYGLTSLIGEGWWGMNNDSDLEEKVEDRYEKYGHLFPELTKDHFREAIKANVDHQSRETDAKLIDELRDPHSVVFGGNDNEYDYNEDYKYGPNVDHYRNLGRY